MQTSSNPEALEGRCRLLDRVCGEVSRLHYYAAKGEDLAFMTAMQPRVDAAMERLQAALDAAMSVALQASSTTALGICLHAYAALGRPQAAEQVVRNVVVTPLVQGIIAKHKASSTAPLANASGKSWCCTCTIATL